MSVDNVELVRRAFEAWNDGDLDRWAEAFEPDIVVIAPEGWPDGEVNRGLDEWRRQSQRLRDSWTDARAELDEVRPCENGAFARIRYTGTSDTGLPFDISMAAVFFMKNGKVTLGQYFWETADALEAAGLSEQGETARGDVGRERAHRLRRRP